MASTDASCEDKKRKRFRSCRFRRSHRKHDPYQESPSCTVYSPDTCPASGGLYSPAPPVLSEFHTSLAFITLPREVQLHVFSFLPLPELLSSARVCRSWRDLAYDGTLWSRIRARGGGYTLGKDFVTRLAMRGGRFVRHLDVSGVLIEDRDLVIMARHCPNLMTVGLRGCRKLTERGLVTYILASRRLQCLDLSGMEGTGDPVMAALVVSGLASGTMLWSLKLASCPEVTSGWFEVMIMGCGRELRTLQVDGCAWIGERSLRAIGRSCTRLKRFAASGCCPGNAETATSTARRKKMGGALGIRSPRDQHKWVARQIQSLAALANYQLGDPTVLETIMACCCTTLPDHSMSSSGVTAGGLARLLEGAPCLMHLNLSHTQPSPSALRVLAYGRWKCVKRLELASATHLTNDILEAIVNSCSGLTHLDVEDCQSLTDVSVLSMAAHCHALRHLILSFNGNITDRALIQLLHANPHLQHLELNNCSKVTNHFLEALGYNPHIAESLQVLEVSDCGHIMCDPVINLERAYAKYRESSWGASQAARSVGMQAGLRREGSETGLSVGLRWRGATPVFPPAVPEGSPATIIEPESLTTLTYPALSHSPEAALTHVPPGTENDSDKDSDTSSFLAMVDNILPVHNALGPESNFAAPSLTVKAFYLWRRRAGRASGVDRSASSKPASSSRPPSRIAGPRLFTGCILL